jgi:hypothetical protein
MLVQEAIMPHAIEFIDPKYNRTNEPDMEAFRGLVLDLPDSYWMQGNGQAEVVFLGKSGENTLLISPNKGYGVALKIFGEGFDWLSLHDRSRLAEITTVSHDWLTSVGLFLPPDVAWVAIEEFCRTGERSKAVEWIRSTDMPDESNW